MKFSKKQSSNLRRILNIVSSGVSGVPSFEITSNYMVFDVSQLNDRIRNELNEYGYNIEVVADVARVEF